MMEMKRKAESHLWKFFIQELHNTTKLTWITLLLCVVCVIAIVTIDISDIAKVCLHVLQISFVIFAFHTGYRKENVCFYTICLSATIPLTVISIYNIATYVPEIRAPFGFVIIGMNLIVFLAAQIVQQIGLIVRRGHLKDSSIKLRRSIICIIICAAILPVVFVFTVVMALGENFY